MVVYNGNRMIFRLPRGQRKWPRMIAITTDNRK